MLTWSYYPLTSCSLYSSLFFFFFNDTATTEIYTLSLHDALPISSVVPHRRGGAPGRPRVTGAGHLQAQPAAAQDALRDRKSTRLNSSHGYISYAVFCLKKKKKKRLNNSEKICC